VGVRKVLVVDDDDEVREITKLSLEVMGGLEVVDADRGAAALVKAREHQPDVVLLDVMMPEMDGPATFRAMQRDPLVRHIPGILLTAKVMIGETQVWDDLAVAGVISRPFTPPTLPTQVDGLVAAHRRHAAGARRLSA